MYGDNPNFEYGFTVELDGHTLRYKEKTWEVDEAPRFGQKINIGTLKYADFNPFDSAAAISSLSGGYGLARYSDNPDPDLAATQFLASIDLDTRALPITVADERHTANLNAPGITAEPIWMGEFTPTGGTAKWVVVRDTYVWTFDGTTATLVLTLPATPLANAIGVFNGHLIFGYGSTRTAQYTDDLATLGNVTDVAGPTNIYVYAFTADRASAYVAGGTATTDLIKVQSSAAGLQYSGPVVCGTKDHPINSLAPGGGVAIVYVGKTTELGCIGTDGNYHILIPYDSSLATNTSVLRWWLASGSDAQRGPLMLFFNRERSLWQYQPSTQDSGDAANVSPWNADWFKTYSVLFGQVPRGVITAIQGTARWLYAAVWNGVSESWIVCRDSHTGRWHIPYQSSSSNHPIYTMGITSLFGSSPRLLYGDGYNLGWAVLPLDGDRALDDPNNCTFLPSGGNKILFCSAIDLGFPDEDKVGFTIRVVADDLTATEYIKIFLSTDNASFGLVGTATQSPTTDIQLDADTVGKRFFIQAEFFNSSNTKSPKLYAIIFSCSLNTTLRKMWKFVSPIPGGLGPFGEDFDEPKTLIDHLWLARKNGTPVTFRDRWGTHYVVRILQMVEKEIERPPDKPPITEISFSLLEVGSGEEEAVTLAGDSASGAFLPITL